MPSAFNLLPLPILCLNGSVVLAGAQDLAHRVGILGRVTFPPPGNVLYAGHAAEKYVPVCWRNSRTA